MKVSYRTAGSGTYTTLGDDGARDYVTVFGPRLALEAQVEGLFRGSSAKVYGRGNRRWELVVEIVEEHSSLDAATSHVQSQAAALPALCDLKVEEGATTVYLARAALVGYEPAVTGRSTRIVYRFTGETLTSTAP